MNVLFLIEDIWSQLISAFTFKFRQYNDNYFLLKEYKFHVTIL